MQFIVDIGIGLLYICAIVNQTERQMTEKLIPMPPQEYQRVLGGLVSAGTSIRALAREYGCSRTWIIKHIQTRGGGNTQTGVQAALRRFLAPHIPQDIYIDAPPPTMEAIRAALDGPEAVDA